VLLMLFSPVVANRRSDMSNLYSRLQSIFWRSAPSRCNKAVQRNYLKDGVDRCCTKENVDFNPKEKSKGGSKVMVLTDKRGIPLSTIVVSASRHESQLLEETLGNIRCERPHPRRGIQNLCGNRAYDSIWCRESADEYGYRVVIL